jgi:hypothetical protein
LVLLTAPPTSCQSSIVDHRSFEKTAKFTIDTLVEMLSRVGKPVKLAIS